jgi:hypothetical protein
MRESGIIHYITHPAIDKTKWDACLEGAGNGLIYAGSFYLDTMAGEWDALVLNDYEAVMPLTKRKKWGFHYLFQPFLTPVLGVFGNSITESLVTRFLDSIPPVFKLWDISLNPSNKVNPVFGQQIHRHNYILSLQPSYEVIACQFSDNISRNIVKAQKNECRVRKGIDIEEIIAICRKEYPGFISKIEAGTFEKLGMIFGHYKKSGITYGVYDRENKLLASCAFLFFRQRAYYWLVGNSPENRDVGASHLLVDSFIRDYAGNDWVLDFEGSDEPSVATFYQRFGAFLEPYTTIYNQRLPFPFNLFKKMPAHYSKLAGL